MKEYILKLPRNRVRRNYMGGAGIDALHHEKVCKDNDQPEEWVGSMVEATNLGLPVVENEGLCMIPVDGKKYRFAMLSMKRSIFISVRIFMQTGAGSLAFSSKYWTPRCVFMCRFIRRRSLQINI